MNEVSANTAPHSTVGLHKPGVSFGPFLILEALPWLLLATVTRGQARMMESGLGLLLLLLSGAALFFAFLIASQNMIRSAGGVTGLGRLPFSDQWKLAWSVVWRLLVFFLAAVVAARLLDMNKFSAAAAWLGFDGIVFSWPNRWHPAWNALIATLVFLMVVERGMDRKPRAWAVAVQFFKRRRHLIPAIVTITFFLLFMDLIQPLIGGLLQPIYDNLPAGPARNLVYVGFIFVFGYVRLLVTIMVLTLAIKASYRNSSKQPSDACP